MTKIEQQVMAGVAMVYTARVLTSSFVLKVYALTLSVAGIMLFVSLPHIMTNIAQVAQGGLSNLAVYTLGAISQTKIVVQVAIMMGMFATISLILPLLRFQRPLETSRS